MSGWEEYNAEVIVTDSAAKNPDDMKGPQPPLPPVELRRLVCHDDALFEIREGLPVFPEVPMEQHRSVFDFGCGCGRIARQLMCQQPRPERYVGIDIHKGMIEWCQNNLTPVSGAFTFKHHDVWNLGLGPDNTRQSTSPFPAEDNAFTLVIAHSVFTHVYKGQTEFYLSEIARILAPQGIARTTWFFFDRLTFPMLFDFQVNLFVNEIDPTNAVIYDWKWFLEAVRQVGLCVRKVVPPGIRGHQWEVYLERRREGSIDQFPSEPEALHFMCGSGVTEVSAAQAVQAHEQSPLVEPTIVAPSKSTDMIPRHRLRFKSKVSPEEFRSRCSELEWWYHSYYFDNGFEVRGDYDIGADVAGYGFPDSMKGMSVLDIGTGAGWFAHYFEQLGADVVTVDARGYGDFDVYGRFDYPGIDTSTKSPDRYSDNGDPIYFSPVSRGFWIMKDLLGSTAKFRNARVYDISPKMFGGRKFDLVFLGAILCHLRDPIGALMAARSVCGHRVISSTPVVIGEPEGDTLPRQYLPYTEDDKISWWLPNEACFRHWFLAAGFISVDISRQVTLRSDVPRVHEGRQANGDQTIRVGTAFVP